MPKNTFFGVFFGVIDVVIMLEILPLDGDFCSDEDGDFFIEEGGDFLTGEDLGDLVFFGLILAGVSTSNFRATLSRFGIC